MLRNISGKSDSSFFLYFPSGWHLKFFRTVLPGFFEGDFMIVSTRGRYALRVIIDMAEHQEHDEYIALKEIAERQNISQKYIEAIMTILSKAGLVDAVHGKGGGYRLNRPPENYRIRDILEVTEGTLAPVACLEKDAPKCDRAKDCRTLPLWKDLYDDVSSFFDRYSVADLMKK